MSGIFGIVYFDGKPVAREVFAAMGESLAHRGPDGRGAWISGPVGLGHRLLWVTPESLHEKQPLANADGSLVITADARIDNRDELIAEFGYGGRRRESLTDVELILDAYQRWGEECANKLLGDFAFAIWDDRKRQLFCARDHVGIRPFYYHHQPGRFFAFASEVKALFEVPGVVREINEQVVAKYLVQQMDCSATFYRGMLRLPPAHTIAVAQDGLRCRRYWELDPCREVTLPNDAAYAECLREIFTEAVRCRLRSASPVGSHLSGGLDSSSVVCFGRQILRQSNGPELHTFSLLYENFPEADEREFIHEVVNGGSLSAHFVAAEGINPFEHMHSLCREVDEPMWPQGLLLYSSLDRAARDCGVRVLLDGDDGDNAVGYGDEIITEHFRGGHWIAAYRELTQFAAVNRIPKWPRLKAHAHVALPQPLIAAWRRLKRPWDAVPRTLIDPMFARRAGIKVELPPRRMPPAATKRQVIEQWRNLTNEGMAVAFEMSGKAAATTCLERRYPFEDKRLLEFCLAIPTTQKFHQGWNRMVMRRAVAGVVPDKIRWRGSKANAARFLLQAVTTHGRDILDDVIHGSPSPLEGYVDMKLLREQYKSVLAGSRSGFDQVWCAANLGLWLRHSGSPMLASRAG